MLSILNAVISTNERNWILTGHVIFKLRYNQIYQLKTTYGGFQLVDLIIDHNAPSHSCINKDSVNNYQFFIRLSYSTFELQQSLILNTQSRRKVWKSGGASIIWWV